MGSKRMAGLGATPSGLVWGLVGGSGGLSQPLLVSVVLGGTSLVGSGWGSVGGGPLWSAGACAVAAAAGSQAPSRHSHAC